MKEAMRTSKVLFTNNNVSNFRVILSLQSRELYIKTAGGEEAYVNFTGSTFFSS